MHNKKRILGALFASIVIFPSSLLATTMTLPDFTGDQHLESDTYPLASVEVGTFTSLPTNITTVSVSGTFGNVDNDFSAGVDLYLDGIMVGQCVKDDNCWFEVFNDSIPVPWNHTFIMSELGIFDDGEAVLTAVQTSEFKIALGSIELSYDVGPSPIPIPATAWLFFSGLVGLAGVARSGAIARSDHPPHTGAHRTHEQ